MPGDVMENVSSRILPKLLKNPDWKELIDQLWDEIREDYRGSWQKSIVDYVLMDSAEKKRLRIEACPQPHAHRTIRAPVPWHDSFHHAKQAQTHQLFVTNHLMTELHDLWWKK